MASVAASTELVCAISTASHRSLPTPFINDAQALWSEFCSLDPPRGSAACQERVWDGLSVATSASSLLESARDDADRARLLTCTAKESGAWLQALPISSLGLRLDDSALRIAVGLRLGTAICVAHQCRHCGEEVDCRGTHGLSCRHSEGRLYRHGSINSIIHRALNSAKISSRLEPAGLSRSDRKRPNGMSIVPWSSSRLLVWDATCPDTLAASYRGQATAEAGKVVAAAEDRKANKYIHLDSAYFFIPLAFETLGVFGHKTLAFVREFGRRISQETDMDKLPHAVLVHGCADGKFSCGVGVLQAPLTDLLLLLLLLLYYYYYYYYYYHYCIPLLSLLHSVIINK